MNPPKRPAALPIVILVTDVAQVPRGELRARLERASALGASRCRGLAVQLRDPALDGRALWDWGLELSRAVKRIGARLWINDRMDLAMALDADGVHLGRKSVATEEARRLLGPDVLITRSAHSVGEVLEVARYGADAALLSPIYPSPGKGPSLGVSALTRAKQELDAAGLGMGLFALGGVDAKNAEACLAAGADGIAVVRGDLGSTLASLLAT